MRKSLEPSVGVRTFLMLGVAASLAACGVDADSKTQSGSSSAALGAGQVLLSAHVTVNGVGVPGVALTVKNASQQVVAQATTDNYGDYTFNVARGLYTLGVSKANARFSPASAAVYSYSNQARSFTCTSGCSLPKVPLCEEGTAVAACRQSLTLGSGAREQTLHVYRDRPLSPPAPGEATQVSRAIVVLHGHGGDADEVFEGVKLALQRVPGAPQGAPVERRRDTIVVAPDLKERWQDHWEDGEPLGGEQASAFTALEDLAALLTTNFPHLQSITFTGFSAGGQAVQRFAAMSRRLPSGSSSQGPHLRFVVASPSSYLYFNDARVKRNRECPDANGECNLTVSEGSKRDFTRPSDCDHFDDYKYGFDDLEESEATAWARYRERDITYLVNTGDACEKPCSATGGKVPPTSGCITTLQGPDDASYRMQRGLVYFNHLWQMGGGAAPADQRLYVLPGNQENCGHDAACMYRSDLGLSVLLGVATATAFDPLQPLSNVVSEPLDADSLNQYCRDRCQAAGVSGSGND
jgi:hypothetical protein